MLKSLSEIHRGRIGELLTAAHLESFGAPCSIVHQDKTDILAWSDNHPIRIQVKSRTGLTGASYQFPLAANKKGEYGCDVFAFVALDRHAIIFDLPPPKLIKTKRIKPHLFTEKKAEATWHSALHKLALMRGNSNESTHCVGDL